MEEIEDICRKLFYFTDKWKDYGRRMRDAEHTLIEALEINLSRITLPLTVGRYTIRYENSRLEVDEKIEPAEPVTMKMLEEENAPEWAKAAFKAFGEEE